MRRNLSGWGAAAMLALAAALPAAAAPLVLAAAVDDPQPADDAALARDVKIALEREALLVDNAVQIRVARGVVTLDGTVLRAETIDQIRVAAMSVSGVKGVNNLLQVRPVVAE